MKRFRDAITGLFIRPADAAARPDTTVAESSDLATEAANLRWTNDSLTAALAEAAGDLEILARQIETGTSTKSTPERLRVIAAEARDAVKLYRRAA